MLFSVPEQHSWHRAIMISRLYLLQVRACFFGGILLVCFRLARRKFLS